MIVGDAKEVARRWVMEEAGEVPGFFGAFFAGSTGWLADEDVLPAASDVDVMVVLSGPDPPGGPGKFLYRDVLLEVSYLPGDLLRSPGTILGHYHLAGSFRTPSIIADPSGRLTELSIAVSEGYAKRHWVYRRCEDARSNVLRHLRSLDGAAPFYDGVTAWLFGTGVTTHVLLVAGLENPTVRRRYAAVRELLAGYGRPHFHEDLLELLGCAEMGRARVGHHLGALADVFDAAKTVGGAPFFFASDISDAARPIPIEGSRELIERGHHREAVFWIVATYARCLKMLDYDGSPKAREFGRGFEDLLGDLGITSPADLARRAELVETFLPRLWEVAEAIMRDNGAIQD